MRRTAEEKAKRKMILTIINGVLSCLGALFLLLLLFALIAAKIDMSDRVLSVLSGIALGAGCFAASYTTAKCQRKKGLLTGVFCGGIIFLTVLLCALFFGGSFSPGGFFAKILLILSCSCIGGIIGVNSKRNISLK